MSGQGEEASIVVTLFSFKGDNHSWMWSKRLNFRKFILFLHNNFVFTHDFEDDKCNLNLTYT